MITAKVLVPRITSWIEDRCNLTRLRIDSRQVCAFVVVAVEAGPGEVVDVVTAAVLARDNMLDMKGSKGRVALV